MTVREIYAGSNGEATTALYKRLEALGPAGVIATNLFRACKCSSRAKVYRGGKFKGAAYDRKNWSMQNLCQSLEKSAAELGIQWGWKIDPKQEFHRWVLYIDLPTGQASFHSATRLSQKDYPGEWDGTSHTAEHIIRWTAQLLGESMPPPAVWPLDRELIG